jgi:hypothetical protein
MTWRGFGGRGVMKRLYPIELQDLRLLTAVSDRLFSGRMESAEMRDYARRLRALVERAREIQLEIEPKR